MLHSERVRRLLPTAAAVALLLLLPLLLLLLLLVLVLLLQQLLLLLGAVRRSKPQPYCVYPPVALSLIPSLAIPY